MCKRNLAALAYALSYVCCLTGAWPCLRLCARVLKATRFPASSAAAAQQEPAAPAPEGATGLPAGMEAMGLCLASKCSAELTACLGDPDCQAMQQCSLACAPGNLTCSNDCFFFYADPVFSDFIACGARAGCLASFQTVNSTCPDFEGRQLADNFTADLFDGTFYVARGAYSYDCLPCATVDHTPAPNGTVSAVWSSYTAPRIRNATYVIQPAGPGRVIAWYNLFGTPVEEHQYIVDFTDDASFILYFYCGYSEAFDYQGAMLYSREPNAQVPPEVAARFSAAIERSGLHAEGFMPPFDQLCAPAFDNCPNIESA